MKHDSVNRFGRLRRFFRRTLMGSPRSAGILGAGEILLALYSATLLIFLTIPVYFEDFVVFPVLLILLIPRYV